MSKELKHVLITGTTGGLGQALALAYAKPGVRLSLFGRKETILDRIAEECRQLGGEVDLYLMDLRQHHDIITTVEKIDRQYPVDLVIANAGVAVYLESNKEFETWEDIQLSIDTNLSASIATIFPLIKRMSQRHHGQIALMSSLAAYNGLGICPSYCATKAALKAYGESLRWQLMQHHVNVSVICPGFVESEMSRRFPGEKPFLISAQQAANYIQRGLQKNKATITFPFLFGLGTRLLMLLPEFMRRFILQKLAYHKPS